MCTTDSLVVLRRCEEVGPKIGSPGAPLRLSGEKTQQSSQPAAAPTPSRIGFRRGARQHLEAELWRASRPPSTRALYESVGWLTEASLMYSSLTPRRPQRVQADERVTEETQVRLAGKLFPRR